MTVDRIVQSETLGEGGLKVFALQPLPWVEAGFCSPPPPGMRHCCESSPQLRGRLTPAAAVAVAAGRPASHPAILSPKLPPTNG